MVRLKNVFKRNVRMMDRKTDDDITGELAKERECFEDQR